MAEVEGVRSFHVREVKITPKEGTKTPYNIDGDPLDPIPIHIKCLKQYINVFAEQPKPQISRNVSQKRIEITKFDDVEQEVNDAIHDEATRDLLWTQLDKNNNGIVSLAEVDTFTAERYPLLHKKPVLMRAYKKTIAKAGASPNDGKMHEHWVHKADFPALLRNLFYFSRAYEVFAAVGGTDGRMSKDEFKRGLGRIGVSIPESEVDNEFAAMDSNKGGMVLFDEFCNWLGKIGADKAAARRSVAQV